MLASAGLVNRAIDIAAASAKGIIVAGSTGAGNSTLEHIWALIFAVARGIPAEDAHVKNNNPQWQTVIPIGLKGKTLSLLGVGRLGSQTAQVRVTSL